MTTKSPDVITTAYGSSLCYLTFWSQIFFILAHLYIKCEKIQEPNTLELLNKLNFEEKKNGEYMPCLKHSVSIFVE